MAITVHQQPQLYTPVYNGLHFVLSSNNIALPNFTIQMRVKDGATTLGTLDYAPRPDDYVIADAGRFVESVISPDITPIVNGAGWQKSASFNKYTIEFQESFGTVPEVSGATTTVTQYAFNGALRYFDFNRYQQSDYLVDRDGIQNFLTYMPQSVFVRMEQQVELGVFTQEDSGFNPVYRAIIKVYDAAGNNTQLATVDNPYNTYSNDDERFLSFVCGPADLNNLVLTTGSQPLLNDGSYRYTVEIESDDGPQTVTIVQEFILNRECSKFDDHVVLYFLNPLGRFDSFAFSLANQESYDFIREQYRKYAGQFDADTQAFAFNPYGEQRVVFDTQEQPKWRLNSDYMNQETAKWLRDLIGSPKVYMTHPDYEDELVEVIIDQSTYTPPKRPIDRLFNLELNVSISALNFRQRL